MCQQGLHLWLVPAWARQGGGGFSYLVFFTVVSLKLALLSKGLSQLQALTLRVAEYTQVLLGWPAQPLKRSQAGCQYKESNGGFENQGSAPSTLKTSICLDPEASSTLMQPFTVQTTAPTCVHFWMALGAFSSIAWAFSTDNQKSLTFSEYLAAKGT